MILTKFWSLAAPEIVKMTTSDRNSFGNWRHLRLSGVSLGVMLIQMHKVVRNSNLDKTQYNTTSMGMLNSFGPIPTQFRCIKLFTVYANSIRRRTLYWHDSTFEEQVLNGCLYQPLFTSTLWIFNTFISAFCIHKRCLEFPKCYSNGAKLRKRWRATAWCGKSKFAISSGWLTNGSLCHPDDITALS